MTDHIETRKKLKNIPLKSQFATITKKYTLSNVENEVLNYWYIDHLTFYEIADRLNVSERTARRYHANALRKIKDTIFLVVSFFCPFIGRSKTV